MRGAFFLVLAFLVASSVVLGQGAGPAAKVTEQLGEAGVALLKGATKVEAFRIDPKGGATENHIAGHKILSKGSEKLDKDFAGRLGLVMTDEKTYTGTQARCFIPGVAYRVWKEKASAEVLICFACTNHRVIVKDADGKVVKQGGGGFGPDVAPLLKLAKEAFPGDKEIQEFKEKK